MMERNRIARLLCLALCWLVLVGAAPARAEEPLALASQAAVLLDADTGTVLYEKNMHQALYPASITKLMTALLAVQSLEPEQVLTVSQTAVNAVPRSSSHISLLPGEQLTAEQALYAIGMESANDAANVLAEAVAGSLAAFAEQMTEAAQALGATDTHFSNANGLPDSTHTTTAYDMALLARAALQNPLFAGIAASRRMTVSYGQPPYARSLLNHNRLLSLYGDAIGVKTGFTKKAGRCLVSAAEKDGVRLICVTLNCPDDWNTHAALYQRYFALTESRPLTLEAPPILPVVGGQKAALQTVLVGQPTYTAIRGREEGITVTVYLNRSFCYAPVEAGQPLGQVVWRRGDHVIGTAVLAAGESIPALESHRPWWQKLYG